jgi:hypothetical protein
MPSEARKLPAGQVEVGGRVYWLSAKGALIPEEGVRPQDKLQDELVRALVARAIEVARVVAQFKLEAFEEIDAFAALINERYGAKAGGLKGNTTLATFDGCQRVQVQVADQRRFGIELTAAKGLIDECLSEWTAESAAPLRTIVTEAFDVEKEGKINHSGLFRLLRYEVDDPRWVKAMGAIRDAIVIEGSKRYIRVYQRPDHKAPWRDVGNG